MKISVITPNYNGERFIEQTIRSVLKQREEGVDLEYIISDGASTDGSLEIIDKYRKDIDIVISDPDAGPHDAINRGFERATGDIICWLNSDDIYYPGALKRVVDVMTANPEKALCFGHCPIISEEGEEIRSGISRFKEMFFPLSSRFTIQCINYVSQPATFFRRTAYDRAGALRNDYKCAWDYDLIIRVWRHGGAVYVRNPPLSAFRWHPGSLSGTFFRQQFREEWQSAVKDAGRFSLQALIHLGVWWGIVFCYSMMQRKRENANRG